jgi:hypothetical protein
MSKSLCAALIVSTLLLPRSLFADEPVEKVGMGIGMTAGNMLVVPIKAISVSMGLTAGLLSFIFTGGDTEVTRQAWQNSTEPPYLITPAVAKKAIGERPELQEPPAPGSNY